MDDELYLDEQLTEEERLVRDTVKRWVDDAVIPVIAEHYEAATFPTSFIQEVAKLGLLGMTLPEQYGGSNASPVAYGLACQELERGDSGLRSFVSVQSSLCMFPIFKFGSEEQKKQWLPRMAKAEVVGCFGLTEPDVGSDPASMRTTAKKTKGGWILNGAKLWITNATIADVAVVWAKTEEGIRGFLVEKSFSGFEQREIHQKLSLRASNTGGLSFNDCFVPDSHYLPLSDTGLSAPLQCLTQARYGIAWGAMGAAQHCFEIARDYTKERKQFNKPVASFQLVQKELAEMFTEIVKAACLNLHLGRLKERNQLSATFVSLAKMNACQQALKIARQARNLLGANGVSLEYHVIRHMVNLESVFTYEGTDNIHHLILGRHITGINAFE